MRKYTAYTYENFRVYGRIRKKPRPATPQLQPENCRKYIIYVLLEKIIKWRICYSLLMECTLYCTSIAIIKLLSLKILPNETKTLVNQFWSVWFRLWSCFISFGFLFYKKNVWSGFYISVCHQDLIAR